MRVFETVEVDFDVCGTVVKQYYFSWRLLLQPLEYFNALTE